MELEVRVGLPLGRRGRDFVGLEIFIFLICGDYLGVHSVIIPLAMLTCIVYFSSCELYILHSKKKNLNLQRKKYGVLENSGLHWSPGFVI